MFVDRWRHIYKHICSLYDFMIYKIRKLYFGGINIRNKFETRNVNLSKCLTGTVRVIQNICDMACHRFQKFLQEIFHTHMGTHYL